MDGPCQFLSLDDIIDINAKMLIRAGESDNFIGEDNLRYPDALKYNLDAIQSVMFGVDQYPTVVDKASALGWQISASHVFWEGNKRTGMEACRVFLEINGYHMDMTLDMDVVAMGFSIAKGEVEREEFMEWVRSRTSEVATEMER